MFLTDDDDLQSCAPSIFNSECDLTSTVLGTNQPSIVNEVLCWLMAHIKYPVHKATMNY